MTHYSITVTGKVQGVFYRQSACEKAVQLGLKGFVRNEPDGSVYLEAEGSEYDLGELIAWCKRGPPRAEVREVKWKQKEMIHFKSFDIRR